ncbi:MAG: methyltransferase [candidate division Zixibacteria bacterium SM23_81]|nr:MAG: methyltransferase [candidate division Zixibacteria bacterium SM23_81]
MSGLAQISQRLIGGDIQGVLDLAAEALSAGVPAQDILNQGLLPGMKVVGEKFKKNLIYIPEVVLSAKAMQAAMELLRPHLEAGQIKPMATVVIGTVQGDLHDIGKNLVAMMFKGSGFEVVDLGIDVSPEQFVQEAARRKAHILALSALLTTSMPNMKKTLDLLSERGLRGGLITMVGGAPLTQAYADQIGADGYAQNASLAVERVKELLKSRTPQSSQES